LGKHKEALDFAVASHSLAPSKSEVAERVEKVKKDIVLGMDKGHELTIRTSILSYSIFAFSCIYVQIHQ
jgi:WD and tetratricopeptide repeat-containing protein 1